MLREIEGAARETPDFWILTGRIAFEKQDWPIAIAAFERAEDLGGGSQALSLVMGMALRNAGRIEEARAKLLHAAEGGDETIAAMARERYSALGLPEQ